MFLQYGFIQRNDDDDLDDIDRDTIDAYHQYHQMISNIIIEFCKAKSTSFRQFQYSIPYGIPTPRYSKDSQGSIYWSIKYTKEFSITLNIKEEKPMFRKKKIKRYIDIYLGYRDEKPDKEREQLVYELAQALHKHTQITTEISITIQEEFSSHRYVQKRFG